MVDTFTGVKVILLLVYLAGLTEPAPVADALLREPESNAQSITCVPFASSDTDERGRNTIQEYHLQQMLLAGFRKNNVNRYTISQGGFTSDPDNIPPPCIPVHYYIDKCPNDTYIYIWTVFNAESETGKTLLKLTVYDLRVFGFELCDIYKPPVDIIIELPPETEPNKTSDCPGMMKRALTDFTTLLPGLSGEEPDANNTIPTAKGYAIQWCEEKEFEKYSDDKIATFIGCLLATSKLLIIAFCYEAYQNIVKHKIHRKTHKWYYIYWAVQTLIFTGMIVIIWFTFKYQKNIHSRIIFFVSILIDVTLGIVVLIVLLSQKCYCECCKRNNFWEEESAIATEFDDSYLVPPPLLLFCTYICHWLGQCFLKLQNHESGRKQQNQGREQLEGESQKSQSGQEPNEKSQLDTGQTEPNTPQSEPDTPQTAYSKKKCCTHFWIILTNTASLIMFIASISYLTQALPGIAISYYINPIASLIELGFFELAVIILVVETAFLLYLIDKCTWLCYVHYKEEIPDEVYEDEEISDNLTNSDNSSESYPKPSAKKSLKNQVAQSTDSPTKATEPPPDNTDSKLQLSMSAKAPVSNKHSSDKESNPPTTEPHVDPDVESSTDSPMKATKSTKATKATKSPPNMIHDSAQLGSNQSFTSKHPDTDSSTKDSTEISDSPRNSPNKSDLTSQLSTKTPKHPPSYDSAQLHSATETLSITELPIDSDQAAIDAKVNVIPSSKGNPDHVQISLKGEGSTGISARADLSDNNTEEPQNSIKVNQCQAVKNNKKPPKYIEQYLVNGNKAKLISFGHWKCSCKFLGHWLFYTSAFQIIVAMLLIGMSAPLLYFLMNIIIDQTSNSNDQFKDILAIIPTIAVNTWLLFKYGNISNAIKDILDKATKSAMEHHEHHHHR